MRSISLDSSFLDKIRKIYCFLQTFSSLLYRQTPMEVINKPMKNVIYPYIPMSIRIPLVKKDDININTPTMINIAFSIFIYLFKMILL